MDPIHELIERSFPFNRKERFFTGTVLPGIVCREHFRHFSHLLRLLTPQLSLPAEWSEKHKNILFYTEYNYKESRHITSIAEGCEGAPKGDTPDILFYIEHREGKHLFALEGKMYDRPSQKDLQLQLDAQLLVLQKMASGAGIPLDHIHHFALLPQVLINAYTDTPYYVSWEAVLEAYRFLGPHDYYLDMLEYALTHYHTYKSQPTASGTNSEGKLLGQVIFEEYQARAIARVGRPKGAFQQDLESGEWKTRSYEFSRDAALPNRNWMAVEEFIARVKEYF